MHTSSLTNPRLRSTTGTVTFVRRLVWNVLPGLMLLGVVKMTLLGDEGMLNRHQVKRRLYATQAKVEQVKAENAALKARIRMLRQDPRFMKRAAAEHLLMAEAGSTIYRFEGPIR